MVVYETTKCKSKLKQFKKLKLDYPYSKVYYLGKVNTNPDFLSKRSDNLEKLNADRLVTINKVINKYRGSRLSHVIRRGEITKEFNEINPHLNCGSNILIKRNSFKQKLVNYLE